MRGRTTSGFLAATCLAIGLMFTGTAMASTTIYLCVEEKAEGAVKSGGTTGGSCKAGYDQVALPSEEKEQKKLLEILPYLTFEEKGVDSKPTIRVSGANVQLVSGAGKEEEVNGEGNLVIGYDETPGEQTGSNNLVLGSEQKYTSYGAILGGSHNSSLNPFVDAFGFGNTANAKWSSIVGGNGNSTKAEYSSISGGHGGSTTSGATSSSIGGGLENQTEGSYASVSGGYDNNARASKSSVSGGEENHTYGEGASVTGGALNFAKGFDSSVTGGEGNSAVNGWSVVTGGYENHAEGGWATVLGGKGVVLTGLYSTSP